MQAENELALAQLWEEQGVLQQRQLDLLATYTWSYQLRAAVRWAGDRVEQARSALSRRERP
jgi:hypothetical protein